jgi:hypothetical protein
MSEANHVVRLSQAQRHRLANWLAQPNGACILDRATFESVEDGGILVRTKEYEVPEAGQRHRPERNMPGLADIMAQALTGTSEDGIRRADGLKTGDKDDVDEALIEAIVARRLNQVARLIHEAVHG